MLIFLETLLWVIRFFFGACIFSFLTVVTDRLPRHEDVIRGRSHCTDCGRELKAAELIPCISYICLRGRCAGCGSRIPRRCFYTELTGGLAWIACALMFGSGRSGIISLRGAIIFIYLGILLVVALIDWDTQMIYDRFHLLILALGIAAIWLFPDHAVIDRLIGAVIIAVPMLILALIIPGAFGGGDIKLMAVSGFFLGLAPIVTAAFIGLLTGGGYAFIQLRRKKLDKTSSFAFGPFLAIGLVIAAFFGDAIANWYLGLII